MILFSIIITTFEIHVTYISYASLTLLRNHLSLLVYAFFKPHHLHLKTYKVRHEMIIIKSYHIKVPIYFRTFCGGI